jgi:hypothetical protein
MPRRDFGNRRGKASGGLIFSNRPLVAFRAPGLKDSARSADKPSMEKRGEPRFEAEQMVRATTLGEQSEEFPAQIANISGAGMRLLVDRPVPVGMTLKVEWDEILLLGEVCYCQSMEGGYAIGVELEHALLHTGEMARLARRLLGDADPAWNGDPQAAPVRRRPDR